MKVFTSINLLIGINKMLSRKKGGYINGTKEKLEYDAYAAAVVRAAAQRLRRQQ
jgi:hypothetical protein